MGGRKERCKLFRNGRGIERGREVKDETKGDGYAASYNLL